MLIHDLQSIKRNIKFTKDVNVTVDVRASEQCCWNCLWAVMTYEGLWCEKDTEEVDSRDLCASWEGKVGIGNA